MIHITTPMTPECQTTDRQPSLRRVKLRFILLLAVATIAGVWTYRNHGPHRHEFTTQMPGMAGMIPDGEDPEAALKRVQGMIDSMTKKEKADPDIIDLSRRKRIATGSGIQPQEIKQFLHQFGQMRAIMKQMASMSMFQKLKMMTGLGQAGAFLPGGMDAIKTKGDTGHRKSAKERAEDRKKKKKR